ncbi:tetratricopeptide repeat protein 36, partial [Caerostris extrusa]
EEELTNTVIEAKRLELEAVKKAETGNVEEAIEILNHSIQLAPRRPSGYNNRAQAFRLKGNVHVVTALLDLNNTIHFSGGKGKSACLAYCQRALIYRHQNKQKEAVADFEKAAELGSAFARSQLTLMNPYAALCNQMLRKVISQYQNQ